MTTRPPDDAAEAGIRIAQALELAEVPYAVGGALALGALGAPRGTLDVDINVFVSDPEIPAVVEVLANLGVIVEERAAVATAARDGMFAGNWAGIRIDVFVPSIPFSHEAGRTRVCMTDQDGTSIWFLSAEALAVFKLLFFRPKDLVDLERLVAVQGDALDRSYVRVWLTDMMGEDDERVRAWDDLCRRFAGSQA
jgi:hypothetical protein